MRRRPYWLLPPLVVGLLVILVAFQAVVDPSKEWSEIFGGAVFGVGLMAVFVLMVVYFDRPRESS